MYRKAVTFSFDDGVTQDIRFIDLLNKYGLKGTFNINSQLLGTDGSLEVLGERVQHRKVEKADVPHIYAGHEVAAHTLTHPFLPDLDEKEIVRQVEQDRLKLSELAGYEVVGFAYPGGGQNSNEYVAEVIRENTGVRYARTINNSFGFARSENMFLFRPTLSITKDYDVLDDVLERFLKSEEKALFYIWGHSYEFDACDRWKQLEGFLEKISRREDVLYCTNKEAFEKGF